MDNETRTHQREPGSDLSVWTLTKYPRQFPEGNESCIERNVQTGHALCETAQFLL